MFGSKFLFYQKIAVHPIRLSAACLALALVAAVATPAAGTEWFIDPNGSSAGAGTINDPWDIYALDTRDANHVLTAHRPS